jgi:hypothetical protein
VLEWLWYLNSHPEVVYKSMHGDKDSFRLAFALAGKAANYTQVRASAVSCRRQSKEGGGRCSRETVEGGVKGTS